MFVVISNIKSFIRLWIRWRFLFHRQNCLNKDLISLLDISDNLMLLSIAMGSLITGCGKIWNLKKIWFSHCFTITFAFHCNPHNVWRNDLSFTTLISFGLSLKYHNLSTLNIYVIINYVTSYRIAPKHYKHLHWEPSPLPYKWFPNDKSKDVMINYFYIHFDSSQIR